MGKKVCEGDFTFFFEKSNGLIHGTSLILGREQIKIIEEEHLYRHYEGEGPHAAGHSYWFGATLRRATNR